jgi:hypothetical protein
MAYKDKDVEEFDKPAPFAHESFGEVDWRAFDARMRIQYKLPTGFDTTKYLIDNQALNWKKSPLDRYHPVKDTKLYTELTDKISKWQSWLARKEYGERKQVEGLDQIAQEMQL